MVLGEHGRAPFRTNFAYRDKAIRTDIAASYQS